MGQLRIIFLDLFDDGLVLNLPVLPGQNPPLGIDQLGEMTDLARAVTRNQDKADATIFWTA
jgi:hypothetical protein